MLVQTCRFLLIFFWGSQLSSCLHNSSVYYSDSVNIGEWDIKNSISWEIPSVKGTSTIILNVCHSSEYKYENIYLTGVISHDTDTLFNDVFNVSLMDQSGNWLGSASKKSICVDYRIFEVSQNYESLKIDISQFSRENNLSGIDFLEIKLSSP